MMMSVAQSNFIGLIRAIVLRDFKGQYRKSVLGPLWALLHPVLYLVIFGFIRGVLNIPSDGLPYALFLYAGLLPYLYLAACISKGMMAVGANSAIIKKMSVDATVFPIAAIGNATIDAGLMFLVLFALMLAYSVSLGWTVLWVVPLFVLVALLGFGIALGLAAVGAFRQDVFMIVPYFMQVWLLASPVIYPLDQVPEKWWWLYRLNPMVGIVDGFRQVLLHNAHPDPVQLSISCAWVVVILAVLVPSFRSLSRYFADVLP